MVLLIILLCLFHPLPHVYAQSTMFVDIPIIEDSYVEELYPDVSPWNNRNFYIGTDLWYSKGKTRPIVMPDYHALQQLNILPQDIQTAEFHVYSYQYEGTATWATIDTYTTTAPWNMYSVDWNNQPTISSKQNSTVVSTVVGKKMITITKSFIDGYTDFIKNYTGKGFLLKLNPETDKALILWAHGCDVAPDPPQCDPSLKPYIRIFYTPNDPPSGCELAFPTPDTYSNSFSLSLQAKPSTDPNNDLISYSASVCSDIGCQQSIWQGSITATSKTTTEVADGTYYLSCSANDGHGHTTTGTPQLYTVDTHPPDAPQIVPEPPFTPVFTNIIYWYPLAEASVTYQLETSERASFSSYNSYSPWINDTSYSITHTKEKAYYFRVRAQDKAGNVSAWSEPTSTVIDTSYPQIKYFKSTKTIASPTMKDGEIDGAAYIQGGVDEDNLNSLILHVFTSANKEVYTQTEKEKSYLWTHWPEALIYKDGTYALLLEAKDELNRSTFSDPLFLTLDTTAPKKPIIQGIRNGVTYTSARHVFSVSCESDSIGTVYVSGRTYASGKNNYIVSLDQSDGPHTISATCTDHADNKSDTSITYTIDTTPPAPPSFSLSFQQNSHTILGTISCREDGKVELYEDGILITAFTCKKGSSNTKTLVTDAHIPELYTFTARVADKAGNWSALTEKSLLTTADVPKAGEISSLQCTAVYQLTKQSFSSTFCTWPSSLPITYQKTVPGDTKGIYLSYFTKPVIKPGKLQITYIACKQFTFWDPRTWFTCIEEPAGTDQNEVAFTFEPQTKLSGSDTTSIVFAHLDTSTVSLTSQLSAYSFLPAHEEIAFSAISPNYTQTFAIHFESTGREPYFSWFFSKKIPVSQWYGFTAFQKPHTGIDFSAYEEVIRAPATGVIVSAGYAKSDRCNSGGNYIAVKHPNGLYSYYFHLKSLISPTGKRLAVNQSVKQGDLLAVTGNTGMFNCETLGYHLHFEVRTSAAISSHVNPVPYIHVEWNSIPTAKANIYPERLTGQNPHPAF